MTEAPHPSDPQEYKGWVKELKRKWEAGVIPNPQTVAIIITNDRSEVLLQLRDDNPQITFANHWTLPGGVVNPGENHEDAACRELLEETGLRSNLSHWKMYKRKSDVMFVIEQHVYFGNTGKNVNEMVLGEGQALEFFGKENLGSLQIGYDFDELLDEFFEHFK
jgi:8-oxo-dGTP diphosphatase